MTKNTRNTFNETDEVRIERRKRIVRSKQDWDCAVALFRRQK